MREYHIYGYNGPVMEFDKCIDNCWKAETVAISEKKARSNLSYQYKKKYNRVGAAKISLPGKITMVS